MPTFIRARVAYLLVVFAIVGGIFSTITGTGAIAQTTGPQAEEFVRTLGDQTLQALKSAGDDKSRQVDGMRSIFQQYFAVKDIGRFVLSRYWRSANQAERDEYLRLFEDLIVYGYAKRFSGYAGERLAILGHRVEDDGSVTVLSEILSSGGNTGIAVSWQVESIGGEARIVDVVVEGVSLKLTQRSDFTAAIKQQGGRVAGLIDLLRDKTAALKAEAEG